MIKSVLAPRPPPRFRVVQDHDPALCRHYVNDVEVTKVTYDRLNELHWVSGVSRIMMEVADEY